MKLLNKSRFNLLNNKNKVMRKKQKALKNIENF